MLTENEKKMRKVYGTLATIAISGIAVPIAVGVARGSARAHGTDISTLTHVGEYAGRIVLGAAGVFGGLTVYANSLGPSGSSEKKTTKWAYMLAGGLAGNLLARGIEYAAESITYNYLR